MAMMTGPIMATATRGTNPISTPINPISMQARNKNSFSSPERMDGFAAASTGCLLVVGSRFSGCCSIGSVVFLFANKCFHVSCRTRVCQIVPSLSNFIGLPRTMVVPFFVLKAIRVEQASGVIDPVRCGITMGGVASWW